MIEIREVGLIDIGNESLEGLTRMKWVRLSINEGKLLIEFLVRKEIGSTRIRYYQNMAQIQAEDFIKENGLSGVFKTRKYKNTLIINL